MAKQGSGSRSNSRRSKNGSSRSSSRSRSNSSDGRSSSRRKRSKREFADYSITDPKDIPARPDVLVDVPVVKVDEIDIEVDDLRAQVAVNAEVQKLVQLSIGADAHLGKVELKIEGVEAQALLKARLDNVTAILERVLTTLDRNPELLESVGQAVEEAGGGTGKLLAESGEAVEDVGEGAEGAVQDVGQGAGQAVGQVGQGAGQGVGQLGQGAGQAAGNIGQGAKQAVDQVGQGAGQAVGGVGQGAQQATDRLAQGGGQ
jgi:hypothetical protein